MGDRRGRSLFHISRLVRASSRWPGAARSPPAATAGRVPMPRCSRLRLAAKLACCSRCAPAESLPAIAGGHAWLEVTPQLPAGRQGEGRKVGRVWGRGDLGSPSNMSANAAAGLSIHPGWPAACSVLSLRSIWRWGTGQGQHALCWQPESGEAGAASGGEVAKAGPGVDAARTHLLLCGEFSACHRSVLETIPGQRTLARGVGKQGGSESGRRRSVQLTGVPGMIWSRAGGADEAVVIRSGSPRSAGLPTGPAVRYGRRSRNRARWWCWR